MSFLKIFLDNSVDVTRTQTEECSGNDAVKIELQAFLLKFLQVHGTRYEGFALVFLICLKC